MKKYRIKDKYKHLFKHDGLEMPIERWVNVTSEALEEVPQRIELDLINEPNCCYIARIDQRVLTSEQLELCEKALNGELLDIDSFDGDKFNKWYTSGLTKTFSNDGVKEVLKEYLKQC